MNFNGLPGTNGDDNDLPPEVILTFELIQEMFGVLSNPTSEAPAPSQPERRRPKPPTRPAHKSDREDYEVVAKFFNMIFEGSLVCPSAVRAFLFRHIFTLHAFILKMKELSLQKNYAFAAVYDMIQEYLWFKIKSYLFDYSTKKLRKKPTQCLVFYCHYPGNPFYLYNSEGVLPKTLDEEKDTAPSNPTPHFCTNHATIGVTLQGPNKHKYGRLFGQLLPEIYWDTENVKSPNHYRSSLGVFWKQWSVPILHYLTIFNQAESFRHVADGVLVQYAQVLNHFLRNQDLEVSLALRLNDFSQPVISENIVEFCLALVNVKSEDDQKTEVLNLVDSDRLNLVRDHSKFWLGVQVSQPTLFEILASNTDLGELDISNSAGLFFLEPKLWDFFLHTCDQMWNGEVS
jgi:hypothetical protein